MNRIIVAVVIGLILALGIFFALRLNSNRTSNQPPAADSGQSAEGGAAAPVIIERANQRIQLYPVQGQVAVLVSEREADQRSLQTATQVTTQPTPETQPQPTEENPTATPEPQPTTAPQPTAVPAVAGQCGTITTVDHKVAAGETLTTLTQRYTTSIVQLAQYGITEVDMVVDRVLKVPTTGCVCPSARRHVVSAGENVFRLAMRYGTTKEEIKRLNGLNADYLIKVGQVLCLP